MKTAIIILNYNGGEDTINCLKSIISTITNDEYVFIVDNGSTDKSYQVIEYYLKSNIKTFISITDDQFKEKFNSSVNYYLIKNNKNKGFGGGNNTVLNQYKNLDFKFNYTWLLNNDLIINNTTLINLKKAIAEDKDIACVGSVVMNLPNNDKIQSTGAIYKKNLGISKLVNKNLQYQLLEQKSEQVHFDYLSGASLLIDNNALNEIGVFDENFFLYSEEFDLQIRLKKKKYKVKLSEDSIVHHKLSSSTSKQKHIFYYYYNMSIIILSKKHFSVLNTTSIVLTLPLITMFRTFPSIKNFYWGLKGILKGIFN